MAGLIDLNRYILDAISHAALAEGVALADNLAALDIDSWNTFCGPKFVCSNLVGVTCDTPTDMEQAVAAAAAYSFEACVVREPVLVDGRQSSVASTPIHAFFVELSEAHADATGAAQRTCQVYGCTKHYEKRYPSGRSVRVVPPGGDNFKDAYTINRLCKNHFQRLQSRKGTKGRVNQRDVMPPEHSFWTDAEIESQPGIRQRQLRLPQTAAPLLHLRCNDVRLPSIQDLCYRASGDGRWVLHNPTAAVSAAFPQTADIYRKALFHCILGKAACLCTSISCAGCTKYTRSWATWSCSNARCARNAFQRFIRATSRPLLRGCSLLVATRLPRGKRSQFHRDSFWRLCTKARASVVPTSWLASPTTSSCEALQFSDRQT